jgi:hypothetical protein
MQIYRYIVICYEVFNFFGTALSIVVLPIGIFYLASEKERYKEKAKQIAPLGFLPALVVLVFQLI